MEVKYRVGSNEIVLTNYGTLLGKIGDLAPSITLQSQRGGNVLVKNVYRHEKRLLDLPMLIDGANETDLRNRVRAILDVLSSGEGIMRITREGDPRELRNVWYTDGLKEKGAAGNTIKCILSFQALDPYWYNPTEVEELFTAGGGAAGGFFPFLPLHLVASTVLSSKTINNPGMETWPVWEISGPGSLISLYNETTGRTFVFTGTLLAGDVLEIDTSPLVKSVKVNGVNAWSGVLVSGADLWPLAAGNNVVKVTMSGAEAASQALMTYYARYISL